MKYSIGKTISKSIKEGKWLNIIYKNKDNIETNFWCCVLDVDLSIRKLVVDIFNIFKDENTKETSISFDNIKEASVVEGTCYDVPIGLEHKIEVNQDKLDWLEYDNFNDKILDYYSEIKKLDNDPYQKEYRNVEGIDTRLLLKNKILDLDDDQFKKITIDIYHNDIDKYKRLSFLAINKLSIYSNGKIFVVAYYKLTLDVKSKCLYINDKLQINKSFLIDDNKVTLTNYISTNPETFTTLLNEKYEEAKELLRDNLRQVEKLDENPFIMLLSRDINIDYDSVYEHISYLHKTGQLSYPLKAFFGEMSIKYTGRAKPNIVLIDKRADIDQVRVVYNAMKNYVTYVQGPPGTGKTTTILNVILSAFLNEQTVLVCSNNNYPIDGILSKFNFTCKYGKVLFPIIRLGNRDELLKTLNYIKELSTQIKDIKIFEDKLQRLNENTSKDYDILKDLLLTYENRSNIEESKIYLDRFYDFIMNNKTSSNRLKDKITKQKETLDSKLATLPIITNQDVLDNVKSAIDDPNFMMYLYFNSYKYIKKLNQPSYEDLKKIAFIEDEIEKVNQFTSYLRNDETFKKFLKVFPVVTCTNVSCLRLGNPDVYFDLAIMDEAGQCDVATSLVPISKATKLLLVGDVNQLQPVISIDESVNKKYMDIYEVPEQYSYLDNSIIKLMTNVDDISKKILLSYHYRCGKKIAEYSNQRYYDNKLNIKTSLEGSQLEYISVENNSFAYERNSYLSEVLAVVDYIKANNLNSSNVSIITPFRNQASLIRNKLKEEGIDNIPCGTIHTVQGAENKNIIFSPCIGLKSSKKTYEWLANNKELINVAVTRAKDKLIFVADEKSLKALGNEEDDIIALSDYVKENGDVKVSKSKVNSIEIGLSNGSECENELFDTLTQFCSVNKVFSVRRNQPIEKVFKKTDLGELNRYFSKAEFDLVLFVRFLGNQVPKLVIELNGGEHYITKSVSSYNDKKKIDICRKYGIRYMSIPNAYSRSYETISSLIFTMNGEEDDEEYNLFNYDSM